MKFSLLAALMGVAMAMPISAHSQVKVGVILSTTGPAASLGIPERHAVSLMPKKIGDYSVDYIFFDDASDVSTARKNMEKLITEEKVDAVIGSSTSPVSISLAEVAGRSKTPLISLGAAISIISPQDENRRWVFKTPYNDSAVANSTVASLLESGAKKIGVIAFNDAYGESWLTELSKAVAKNGPEIVAVERYNRTDPSVTAQVLKVMKESPDAVIVIASGTPAVLPQGTLRERGFKGPIYQTSGVTNADFIRVGREAVEGTLAAAASVVVAADLPADHPAKEPAMDFLNRWKQLPEAGEISAFSGYAWDAYLILDNAIIEAGKKASPGTAEFRTALRDAIEQTKGLRTTNGIVNMSPEDHNGYSADAPVMIEVKNGKWVLAQ